MENPWVHLPLQAPFVLPEDRDLIESFSASVDERHSVHLELLPEPFWGVVDEAKALVLSLNPGYNPAEQGYHADQDFARAFRANLAQRDQEYPFFLLDPHHDSPGHKYWQRNLKSVLAHVSNSKVARELGVVEYFPYHSQAYRQMNRILPSQSYSFELVRDAIARKAFIVVMRGRASWLKAVPELETIGHFPNSPQSGSTSPGNLMSFDALIDALR